MKKEKKKTVTSPYLSIPIMIPISLPIAYSMIWPQTEHIFALLHRSWFQIQLSIAFVTAMFLIIIVDQTSRFLDKKCSWQQYFFKRAGLQLLLGWVAPVTTIYFFAGICSSVLDINVLSVLYTPRMFGIVLFTSFAHNVLYFVYYCEYLFEQGLVIATDKKEIAPEENNGIKEVGINQEIAINKFREYFIIPYTKGLVKVKAAEIAYLFRSNNDILLKTFNGETYALWQSLTEMENELDPNSFCRVNRAYIITIKAFQKTVNKGGRFSIYLEPPTKEPVIVSKEKSKYVKDWLRENGLQK